MAGTCPHCGINIAGNLKQCPNCNEYCLNTQEKCPYCGATLSVETEEKIEPQPEQTTQEAAESKEKPAAKNRKSLIFSITFATS